MGLRRNHVSMGVFGNKVNRADVSAYNKLYDRANYHRVVSSQYSIHHQIALAIHACEKNYCLITKLQPLDKSRKMEGGCHGQTRTACFFWREDVKPSDIHHRLSAMAGEKEPARSTVFDCVRSFDIGCLRMVDSS